MAVTKVTYSMIANAPINVQDYAGLVFSHTTRNPSNPGTPAQTFDSWRLAFQAAFDEADARGGGIILIPAKGSPYMFDDAIFPKSNTTIICNEWLKLGDYTVLGMGGFFTINDNEQNITCYDLKIDLDNIYAGGSGENALTVIGRNLKFFGGIAKNCSSGNGNDGTGDGGKGIHLEIANNAQYSKDVVVDGMEFQNCWIALGSTLNNTYVSANTALNVLYTNIYAEDCHVFFYARQTFGRDYSGVQQSVQLTNFYARNCGSFEGVFQLSRASNVVVSNGIVVNDDVSIDDPLIAGNHAYCSFDNITFSASGTTVIDLAPTTIAPDTTYAQTRNHYDLKVLGSWDYIVNSNIADANRILIGCTGRFQLENDVGTAFFGNELRNGSSIFEVSVGNKNILADTSYNYESSNFPYTAAGIANNLNITRFTNQYQKLVATAAANVENNSVFLNSATSKVSFKDGSGVVHALY